MIRRKNGTEKYVGTTLSKDHTGMSFYDGYEHVWNAAVWTGERIEHVSYGSTMGDCDTVVVDATPEVIAAAKAWESEQQATYRRLCADREARRIERGKLVRVVHGRKVPHGTEGRVFWHGSTRFGRSVGFKSCSCNRRCEHAVFTAEHNVEVVLKTEGVPA